MAEPSTLSSIDGGRRKGVKCSSAMSPRIISHKKTAVRGLVISTELQGGGRGRTNSTVGGPQLSRRCDNIEIIRNLVFRVSKDKPECVTQAAIELISP